MKVCPPITFNKVILHPKRLRIISLLISENRYITFQDVKNALELTDGNLASHLRQLEKHKIIQIEKRFVGKKPQTIVEKAIDLKHSGLGYTRIAKLLHISKWTVRHWVYGNYRTKITHRGH